ncbi:MAG: SIS domain-containing protein [Ktedonobacteraceae bacterium]|nr:SIS domain-containing protein [Ktedonobacteraceae bacterium]
MHFALDDQIASQPQAIRTLLTRIQVPVLDGNRPLIFTGIGTSLHACSVAAFWVSELTLGQVRPSVIHAHDLALSVPMNARDQVVVVSHRGTKRFPGAALARARSVGAATIAIVGEDAPEPQADAVIRTCQGERSGTHTVSYTTALTALGCLVAQLAHSNQGSLFTTALESVPAAIEQVLAQDAPVVAARRLEGREPVLVAGVGLDAITAREAALKIKEGTYQWAEGMETENALHGPPAAMRSGMAALTITPAADDAGRTGDLRTTFSDLGVISLTCGTGSEDLRFPTVHPLVRPLVSIVPLQRLTAELARLKQTNPDDIHRDVEPWKTAIGRVTL